MSANKTSNGLFRRPKKEENVQTVLKEYVKKGTKVGKEMVEEFTDGKGEE